MFIQVSDNGTKIAPPFHQLPPMWRESHSHVIPCSDSWATHGIMEPWNRRHVRIDTRRNTSFYPPFLDVMRCLSIHFLHNICCVLGSVPIMPYSDIKLSARCYDSFNVFGTIKTVVPINGWNTLWPTKKKENPNNYGNPRRSTPTRSCLNSPFFPLRGNGKYDTEIPLVEKKKNARLTLEIIFHK